MFIDNQHTAEYNALIDRARVRLPIGSTRYQAKRLLSYVESHHIIPKSLGGDDTAENKVWLTAAEHLKAHLLLVDMVEDTESYRKMLAAAVRMANPQSRTQQRIIGDEMIDNIADIRAEAARLHGELMSRRHSGENNPFFGRQHTEETKALQRAGVTGDKNSMKRPEVVASMSGVNHYTKREGHVSVCAGTKNPRYDSTIHCFENIKTGDRVYMTRYDFVHRHLGGQASNISSVILGRQSHTKGWRVVED